MAAVYCLIPRLLGLGTRRHFLASFLGSLVPRPSIIANALAVIEGLGTRLVPGLSGTRTVHTGTTSMFAFRSENEAKYTANLLSPAHLFPVVGAIAVSRI